MLQTPQTISSSAEIVVMENIIADIYHAAGGTKTWSDALTRATLALDLPGAQMVGIALSTGAIIFSHISENAPPEVELDYVRTYHEVDPRIAHLMKRNEGEWFYDQDEFDKSMAVSCGYYRDYLIPSGGRYTATVKLLQRDGELTLLGFVSSLRADGFTAKRKAMLHSIGFHLCEAAMIYHERRKLTEKAFVGAELLNRLDRPALLLSIERKISHMNTAGRKYLADGSALLLSNDRLIALDAKSDWTLSQAYDSMVEELPLGNAQPRRVVRLRAGDSPTPVAVSLTAFAPQASMYTFGMAPQILLLVHTQSHGRLPDLLLWEALYDLTPAQSRATREVYLGKSIREGALSLQIAQTTFKTHLRDVFRKTGTLGQAQLISLLAAI